MTKTHPFGSTLEAIVYPVLILVVMWVVYLGDQLLDTQLVKFGVLPRTVEGLKGIFFMPFIHSPQDIHHIINNSVPTLLLSSTVVYFYRDIALKVLLLSWLLSGFGVWFFAVNHGSYHIGMSGMVYALAAFVFVSGFIRRYLPLQAMALFVAFLYGGMIWGVLPSDEKISWEGHLSGMIIGAFLAWYFAEKGPQAPKYQYEIEQEMGIEPPDFEGMYLEKVRQIEEQEARRLANIEEQKRQTEELNASGNTSHPVRIVYTYRPTEIRDRPDENDQSTSLNP
jgi:membrane associated rhomboid family serine protease